MANGTKPDEREPNFTFGTRELREVQVQVQAQRTGLLELLEPVARPSGKACPAGGFDPYNSSGSFDRRKHWERVGRR